MIKRNEEIIEPFLSETIEICERCRKIDIRTYARYKLKNGKYVLDGAYSKCQKCGKTKEFTEDELKQELLIK